MKGTQSQSRQWSRHAEQYDDVFLDPFVPGVINPAFEAIEAIPDAGSKVALDLGCGTGPLLPRLLGRFREVIALDFAPAMIEAARLRLGDDADRVRFEVGPMEQLDESIGTVDVVCAINSIIMPDVRDIDRTLRAVFDRLAPGGRFLGVVPAIDAIQYQTMLLFEHALEQGHSPLVASRLAAQQAEHHLYDFAFGRFAFQGLKQKFWNHFEVEHRLRKAGFREVRLDRVLYPWDGNLPLGDQFQDQPRSWDWFFDASVSLDAY